MIALVVLITTSCKKSIEEAHPTGRSVHDGELKQVENPIPVPEGLPYSKSELDEIVKKTYLRTGDFRWETSDFKLTWSAAQFGTQQVAVGYRPHDFGDISDKIHEIDIQRGEWKSVHDALIQYVLDQLLESTGQQYSSSEIIAEDDRVLPIITFRLTDKQVLTALRNLRNVRYIEPIDYSHGDFSERSSSGCDASTTSINSLDYSFISPNAMMPWNFFTNNVQGSWSSPDGLGVTVGVIDAGISSAQSLLGSQFNNGDSNVGRMITTDYTYGSTAYTTCTHGTSMCGLAAGPRNSVGSSTGVAYKAGLHFIRACENVVLDNSAERTGVKNALVKMGDHPSVKIVSMSIGTPFYSSILEDGVNYAYGKGKLLIAAAGTSFGLTSWWGVVYPAAHAKCVAVTGRKENGNTCVTCHDGPEVDFTLVMERSSTNDRTSLSLPLSGTSPKYIGGSSCATATAAGIAANVWSVKPSFTRAQVLNFLTITSQYYPGASSSHGYGNINAGAAVSAAQAAI